MSVPYEPNVYYRCDDYDCCPDGSPLVRCNVCEHFWPCRDYREAHTEPQVKAQQRWVIRVMSREYGRDDPALLAHYYRDIDGFYQSRGLVA